MPRVELRLIKAETFSFIDDHNREYLFNVSAMNEHVRLVFDEYARTRDRAVVSRAGLDVFNCPLDAEWIAFLRERRGIEQPRVDRLREPYLSQSLLGVEWHDRLTTLIVDGQHRQVKLFELGRTEARVVRFAYGFWDEFLLDRNALIEMPGAQP